MYEGDNSAGCSERGREVMVKIKNKSEVKRILFISLSNIGDIILTTPVLTVLRREFPSAVIDVMAGPNGLEIFSGHPSVSNFIVYDKFSALNIKQRLIRTLRKNRYDLIVDLRNSLFPFLIGSRYRTAVGHITPKHAMYKKDEHLAQLKNLGLDVKDAQFSFYVSQKDKVFVEMVLTDMKIKRNFAVVSPGAKSHIKRWTTEGFAVLCDRIIQDLGLDIVMVGDGEDKKITAEITSFMRNKAFDLAGKFTLRQLGGLIGMAKVLITNDSAALHIGSALGVKVVALFGPTDPRKYGPNHKGSVVIRKKLACSPCEAAQCKKNHECMKLIGADEVFEATKNCIMCNV